MKPRISEKTKNCSFNELLVKQAPFGLALIEASGRWLLVNPAFTRITGYSAEDIPDGKAWFEKAFADPEKRAEFLSLWLLDRKKGEAMDRVLEIVGRDGQKKWVQATSAFLPDGLTVFSVHDISDKKLIESAREEAENYYRALLEATPDMVVVTDSGGFITYASESATRFLGYDSSEELIGRNNQDLFAPEDLEKIRQLGPLLAQQGFLGPFIAKVLKKTGEQRIVEINSSLVRISGEAVSYIGIMIDITDRLKLENELRQALIEKEILIREVHHRVKNNLQLIQSLLRLQSQYHTSPEVRAALKDSLSRVKSIALIYEGLLRSNRVDRINLDRYLERIVSQAGSLYRQEGREIQIVTDLDEVQVDLAEAHPCGLIASELVSNSIKHAFKERRQGTIRVSLKKTNGRQVVLSVSDDGQGLPENLDPTVSTSFGWQIVNDLTKQLRGTLSWKSDRGTEVTVAFTP